MGTSMDDAGMILADMYCKQCYEYRPCCCDEEDEIEMMIETVDAEMKTESEIENEMNEIKVCTVCGSNNTKLEVLLNDGECYNCNTPM